MKTMRTPEIPNFLIFLGVVAWLLTAGEPSLLDAIAARVADMPVEAWLDLGADR